MLKVINRYLGSEKVTTQTDEGLSLFNSITAFLKAKYVKTDGKSDKSSISVTSEAGGTDTGKRDSEKPKIEPKVEKDSSGSSKAPGETLSVVSPGIVKIKESFKINGTIGVKKG